MFNKEIRFEREVVYLDEVTLSYRQNFFTIQFAALNYAQPHKNQYAYRMEGFDQDWVYCGAQNTATYTNLDGGEYVFRVKAADSNGIWNETGASMRIVIKPPFWQTTWFRLLLLFLLLVAAYALVCRWVRQARESKEELEDLVLNRTRGMAVSPNAGPVEQARHQSAEAALRDSEAFFRSFYEQCPLGVIWMGEQGEILKVNNQFCSIIQRPREMLIGQPVKTFVFDEDLARHEEQVREAIVRQLDHTNHEARIVRPGGAPVWVSITASYLYEERSGKFEYAIGMVKNIDERKKQAELIASLLEELKNQNLELEARVTERTHDLSRANEELMKKIEELERFAHISSHDLKEPLRNIAGFITLIRRRFSDRQDQDLEEYFAFINRGVHQLYDLIEDVRNFSQINHFDQKVEKVDLRQVVANVLDSIGLLVSENEAVVSCADLPVITTNASQLFVILKNLIENGIKYNDSQPPRVSIRYALVDGHHELSVSDNGIGIAPEFHATVFEMFRRLHKKSDFSGSGLGLAIVQRLVERLGGTIKLDSAAGRGSTFRIYLPVVGDQAAPDDATGNVPIKADP